MDTTKLPNRMDIPGDHPHLTGDPILRSWEGVEKSTRRRVYALGGLRYFRGNSAPYFSLTMASWTAIDRDAEGYVPFKGKRGYTRAHTWREDQFGCAHEELLARWPELAPLAALHLSDWHGAPMHAAGNGFYELAGYAGGFAERYHGGNAVSIAPPRGVCTRQCEKCLASWAAHVRLPLEGVNGARAEAERIVKAARYCATQDRDTLQTPSGPVIYALACEGAHAKRLHAAFIDAQRPRWKREADACCEALGIRFYYGERMPAVAAA